MSKPMPSLPELPRAYVDTTYSLPTGNTITVNSGGNFQTALNNAKLGDVIVLEAGATFQGPFTLPNKISGTGWIYVISSNYNNLPAPGNRVSPSNASNMPKITVSEQGRSAIETAKNAHHYRFVGIEFSPSPNTYINSVITIGNLPFEDTSASTLPEYIIFDRCYIHGDLSKGARRGVAMDGKNIAVIDSHVSDCWEVGADSQALWAYNTPGPLKIVNNFLSGAGENVMFGGADPKIQNCIPSDIEIKRNHFFKPLSWQSKSGMVKNLLEFKIGRRALVEGNIFENNWPDAQVGWSILFTVRNQDGTAPWSTVEDVHFINNKLINTYNGINMLGTDYIYPSQVQKRILIKNNLLHSHGRSIMMGDGNLDVIIEQNTFIDTDRIAIAYGEKNGSFSFKNNISFAAEYGFWGDAVGEGVVALNTYYTAWEFNRNVIVGGASHIYPSGNFFPSNVSQVGFVDYNGSNYRLSASSPYKNAGTDGKDIGADIDAIEAAIGGISVPVYILGDLNSDGVVNIFDYNIFLQNFGSQTCGNTADLNGDCKVNIFDYNILLENFGRTQ
jgi:hypothetical protein